jgi:cytoskeletal protein RodZ
MLVFNFAFICMSRAPNWDKRPVERNSRFKSRRKSRFSGFPSLPTRITNRLILGIMSTVAEQLRKAREAQGLTVARVVESMKIRTDHLEALERGNFDVFSAPVYIRGFVRSYATLLKLDVPKVMADLDEELGRTQKFAEPPPLTEKPRGVLDFLMLQLSKIDWRIGGVVFGGVVVIVIVVVAYSGWRRSHKADPLSGVKPGIYRPASSNAGQTLPLPQKRPAGGAPSK